MNKVYNYDRGFIGMACLYMVSDGDNVVAWFVDREHAQEFANIRNGNYYVVRRHELDRIKENVDRIFGER